MFRLQLHSFDKRNKHKNYGQMMIILKKNKVENEEIYESQINWPLLLNKNVRNPHLCVLDTPAENILENFSSFYRKQWGYSINCLFSYPRCFLHYLNWYWYCCLGQPHRIRVVEVLTLYLIEQLGMHTLIVPSINWFRSCQKARTISSSFSLVLEPLADCFVMKLNFRIKSDPPPLSSE